ncbi:dynamin-related protein 4C-like protein [Tanacetum coccineum]
MLSLLPYGHGYLQQLCKGQDTTIFLNIKHREKPAILKDADGAEELANGYLQTCTVVAMPQKYTIPYPTGCMPDKGKANSVVSTADSDPPLESTYVDISTGKGGHGHSNTIDDTVLESPLKRPKIYEASDYGKMKSMHTKSVLPARHVLDALDNIRLLNVKHDGIPLPTIVVVGDQSSGKSSLLTSLAGICLPSGASMVTRVPLILRLYHIETSETEIVLKFGKTSKILISEDDIPMAIEQATSEITGDSSGVSSSPITLVVKKRGITDLTLVDLPGLIRVAAPDQPPDICEQIRGFHLPGGFSQNLFDLLLREKVEDIRKLPSKCAADALAYIEKGCMKVVYDQFSSHYPQVLPVAEDAVRMCMNDITKIVMERTEEITTMQWYDFTIDSSFLNAYEKLKSENKDILLSSMDSEMRMANLLVFGKVDVAHLRIIPSSIRDHAFEQRMRLEVYWTVVVPRIVDSLGQRLRMMLADAETKIEQLMVRNILGETGRVNKLMGERESMTERRDHLRDTISVLKKSRDVLASFSP